MVVKCQNSKKKNLLRGFSLIEILLAVTLISIVFGALVIAINPSRQIAKSNNLERESDINAILSALGSYALDNQGEIPSAIDEIGKNIGSDLNDVDFCDDLVPKYLEEIPFDPVETTAYFNDCSDYSSQYQIAVEGTTGRLTITAPFAELGATIEASD